MWGGAERTWYATALRHTSPILTRADPRATISTDGISIEGISVPSWEVAWQAAANRSFRP